MKRSKYDWLSCLKNYRFHSIFFKNLALISLVIMLPFVCVLGISGYAYGKIYASEEKAYTDEMKTMIFKDVGNLFNEFREKALWVSADEYVKAFFGLKNVNPVHYDWTKVQDYVNLYKIADDVTDDVYIYAPYNRTVVSAAGMFSYENFHDQECIDRWQNTEELYQYEYMSRVVYRMKKENVSLYYTMQFGVGYTGVVIFQLDMNRLREMFDYGEHINLVIVGKQQVIYDSTGQWQGMRVDSTEEIKQTLDEGIVITNELESQEVEIILQMDRSSLQERLKSISLFIVLFAIIMFLITVVLAFYISRKIFNPITEILEALEQMHGRNEDRILQNEDELTYIMESISSTALRNKDVENELLERIRLLKKAQAVALQAQITPHFINNTLETINWMAVACLGGNNEISEMLNCLSLLMRNSLEDTDTFITLAEEIEYVEKYLFIQKKRLGDKFDVLLDIPEELMTCKVIKMMLQPIVENAIKYGIIPYNNKGKLRVNAVRREDRVCISVKDSGFGVAQEKVDRINESIRKTVIKESDHIGMSNVNQRIILAFGEEFGVWMKSKINEGTEVILEIPYV